MCLIAALDHLDLLVVVGAVQVVDLSDAANEVDQTIELFYLKALNYALGSILQCFFKFNGFELKVCSQLIELLSVSELLILYFLVEDLVEVGLAPASCILLRRDQPTQLLAYLDRAHLVVVEAQRLNQLQHL